MDSDQRLNVWGVQICACLGAWVHKSVHTSPLLYYYSLNRYEPTYLPLSPLSYRPITDVWIFARSKVKYFGAYSAGFLSRAHIYKLASPIIPRFRHVVFSLSTMYKYLNPRH